LFIVCKSAREALWAVVESVAERLVNTLNGVTLSHEDLQIVSCSSMYQISTSPLTRSKAVEHARGWVATKIGLFDILICGMNRVMVNCGLQGYPRSKNSSVNKLEVDQVDQLQWANEISAVKAAREISDLTSGQKYPVQGPQQI
jgi:hypothetical protein